MIVAATDWTNILLALIAATPGIIAAIYSGRVHRKIKTPSGKPIGEVIEYAHDTAIANNMLLSKANGQTKSADHDTLSAEGHTPPQIPDTPPAAEPGGA